MPQLQVELRRQRGRRRRRKNSVSERQCIDCINMFDCRFCLADVPDTLPARMAGNVSSIVASRKSNFVTHTTGFVTSSVDLLLGNVLHRISINYPWGLSRKEEVEEKKKKLRRRRRRGTIFQKTTSLLLSYFDQPNYSHSYYYSVATRITRSVSPFLLTCLPTQT